LAEGIEERSQQSQLQREHCDSGQGFLYARPLTVVAVEAFLAERKNGPGQAAASPGANGACTEVVGQSVRATVASSRDLLE